MVFILVKYNRVNGSKANMQEVTHRGNGYSCLVKTVEMDKIERQEDNVSIAYRIIRRTNKGFLTTEINNPKTLSEITYCALFG